MGELFYTGLLGTDAIIIAIMLLMFLFVVPIARIPGIFPVMIEALYYEREATFFAHISRYFSISTFRGITHWQSASGISLCAYLWGLQLGLVKMANSWLDLLLPAGLFLSLLLFFFVRRVVYRLLAYLFVAPARAARWRICYAMLEWMWSLSLVPVIVLGLIPAARWASIGLFAALFLAWRILLIVKTIPLFRDSSVDKVHLFVYLCAHETLPFLYLAVGIWAAQGDKDAFLWQ